VWYSQFHALQLNQLPNNDVANLSGVASSDLLLEAGQMSWSGKHLLCASWVMVMIYDFKYILNLQVKRFLPRHTKDGISSSSSPQVPPKRARAALLLSFRAGMNQQTVNSRKGLALP